MPTVHINIIELLTNEKHSSISSFHVLAHTNDFPNHVFKLKINENKYSNILSGDKFSSLFIRSQKNNCINIELKRFHLFGKNDLIGQLVLPLDWFPTNHIVREWFPLQKVGLSQGGMILLDIHVDNRRALPFMAPFAALRVFPCWRRPTLGENCEIPVLPPIVYLVPSQSPYTIKPNQEQNPIPQFQEYVNAANFPVNPYSIHTNEKQDQYKNQNCDDIYRIQTENQQQIQLKEYSYQNLQEKQHFQLYSLDDSDEETERPNEEKQYEQHNWQQSVPNVQQFSTVYYPNLSYDLEN